MAVLGLDVSAGDWVAVRLEDGDGPAVTAGAALAELIAACEPLEVIGVDMPIGLAETGPRACDLLARECVGVRRSSVFITPPADVVEIADYATANAHARAKHGVGLSRQAHALRVKILEVAAVAERDARVIEVHPEVSFRALLKGELDYPKRSWSP
jgi:predicted RNase H-like nuclease